MTVDELIQALREVSNNGQGDYPVVNDDDCDLDDIEAGDDPQLGQGVVMNFNSHPRGYYGDE